MNERADNTSQGETLCSACGLAVRTTGCAACGGTEGRALAFHRAGVGHKSANAGIEPTLEIRQKTVCVAMGAFDAEAQFGEHSLPYTSAYVTYVHDDSNEDAPETYVDTETNYEHAPNQLPFFRPDAVVAFRERPSPC